MGSPQPRKENPFLLGLGLTMTSLQCLKLSKVAIYLKWMGFLGQNSSLPGLFSSFQRECVYLLGCFFSFKLRSLLRFLAKVRTSFLP